MQFNCSPKAHLSEPSGHRSGRRVWIGGSLRSEEKDQCESPRIQRKKRRISVNPREFNVIKKEHAARAQVLILTQMRQAPKFLSPIR